MRTKKAEVIEQVEQSEGLTILRRMVWDTNFLQATNFVKHWMFETEELRKVAEWSLDYFSINKKAMGARLPEVWSRFAEQNLVGVSKELIAPLIIQLKNNPPLPAGEYEIRSALSWAKLRYLEKCSSELDKAISSKDITRGEALMSGFSPVVRYTGQGIELSRDFEKAVEGFNQEHITLFKLPGAIGAMVGNIVCGDFVGVLGPTKRGKTWWLIFFAVQAALRGRRTLYVNLEMPEPEICRRMWQALLGLPSTPGRHTIRYPSHGELGYKMEEKIIEVPVINEHTLQDGIKSLQQSSKFAGIRVESRATNTFTVTKLREYITLLEKEEGCVPEVIVIDYADLMLAEYRGSEERHRVNSIWSSLRGLALELNCAIITASQTGRNTFNGEKDLGAEDVAEDSRKITHITKCITLNQTKEEKVDGIMRVEASVQRDNAATFGQVICLQCLSLGQVCMQSIPAREFVRR